MGRKEAATLRRADIARLVKANGFIRIDELSKRFGVTPMTIHRDLDELDARGAVSKVRSGAKATPIEEIERNVDLRRHHMIQQKRAMARAALNWLAEQEDAKVIALDDSTTALTLVDQLASQDDLTIVSNFLPAIDQVSRGKARLFGLGGSYSSEYQSFQGPSTHETIRSILIDVFFLSATSVGHGAVFHPEEAPLLVKGTLIDHAERSVLMVDHTKFSRRALHRQAGLSEFDVVIVDDGVDEEQLEELRNLVPTTLVAPVETESRELLNLSSQPREGTK